MAEIVYLLCGLTSTACALLLLRGYWRSRFSLLFWSGIAFLAFAVANSLLFVDLVVLTDSISLLIWRQVANLVGIVLLLYGLIRTRS